MPITPYATIFPVNGTTTGDQKNQSVARLTDGRFIVTYESSDTAGQGVDIRTRIFYPDGTPQGPDFLVNQGVVAGNQTSVVASQSASDPSVIYFVWKTPDAVTPANSQLMVRAFNDQGVPTAAEHQLWLCSRSMLFRTVSPSSDLDRPGFCLQFQ